MRNLMPKMLLPVAALVCATLVPETLVAKAPTTTLWTGTLNTRDLTGSGGLIGCDNADPDAADKCSAAISRTGGTRSDIPIDKVHVGSSKVLIKIKTGLPVNGIDLHATLHDKARSFWTPRVKSVPSTREVEYPKTGSWSGNWGEYGYPGNSRTRTWIPGKLDLKLVQTHLDKKVSLSIPGCTYDRDAKVHNCPLGQKTEVTFQAKVGTANAWSEQPVDGGPWVGPSFQFTGDETIVAYGIQRNASARTFKLKIDETPADRDTVLRIRATIPMAGVSYAPGGASGPVRTLTTDRYDIALPRNVRDGRIQTTPPPTTPLTASFGNASRNIHDGKNFTFEVNFNQDLSRVHSRQLREASFGKVVNGKFKHNAGIENGKIIGIKKFSDRRYRVRIRPSSEDQDVVVTLFGDKACHVRGTKETKGSVCTSDGRQLTNSPTLTIRGNNTNGLIARGSIGVEPGTETVPAWAYEGSNNCLGTNPGDRINCLEFKVKLLSDIRSGVVLSYRTDNPTGAGWATSGTDFVETSGTLQFPSLDCNLHYVSRFVGLYGKKWDCARTQRIQVRIHNDSIDEGDEKVRLVVEHDGQQVASGIAVIKNSDPLPKAWVAEFTHSIGVNVVDSIMGRLGSRTGEGVWHQIVAAPIDGSGVVAKNKGAVLGYDRGDDDIALGLAFAAFQAKGDYNEYALEGDMSGLFPYAHWQLTERFGFWGVVGYGQGEVSVEHESIELETDASMSLVAVGSSLGLLVSDDINMSLDTDAVWIQGESEKGPGFVRSESDSYRYQAALNSSYQVLEMLALNLSAGYAIEGGDIEGDEGMTSSLGANVTYNDLGVDLGVSLFEPYEVTLGVNWSNEHWQVGVSASGSNDDDLVWTGAVSYDFDGDQQGMSVQLSPTVGDESQMQTMVGYGFTIDQHQWIKPYLGMGIAAPEHRVGIDYGVGMVVFGLVVTDRETEQLIELGVSRRF